MLLVVTGPDGAGKTTLVKLLEAAVLGPVYVRLPGTEKELLPHMEAIERKSAQLWTALYDPEKLYVCDRCVFVESQAYSRVYGRKPIPLPPWEIAVAYLRRSYAESEWGARTTEQIAAYDAIMCLFPWVMTIAPGENAFQRVATWLLTRLNCTSKCSDASGSTLG